jgi:hypothetical protein
VAPATLSVWQITGVHGSSGRARCWPNRLGTADIHNRHQPPRHNGHRCGPRWTRTHPTTCKSAWSTARSVGRWSWFEPSLCRFGDRPRAAKFSTVDGQVTNMVTNCGRPHRWWRPRLVTGRPWPLVAIAVGDSQPLVMSRSGVRFHDAAPPLT